MLSYQSARCSVLLITGPKSSEKCFKYRCIFLLMIPHWTLSAGPLNGIKYLDMSQLSRRNGLKTSWMSEECEMIPSNCRRARNQWWTLSLWLWRQLQVNGIHRRCSFFSSGEEQLSQTTVVCCGTLPNYSVSLWSGW